jgi:hypothetical protein
MNADRSTPLIAVARDTVPYTPRLTEVVPTSAAVIAETAVLLGSGLDTREISTDPAAEMPEMMANLTLPSGQRFLTDTCRGVDPTIRVPVGMSSFLNRCPTVHGRTAEEPEASVVTVVIRVSSGTAFKSIRSIVMLYVPAGTVAPTVTNPVAVFRITSGIALLSNEYSGSDPCVTTTS